MTNTTTDTFSIGALVLNTLGYNISTKSSGIGELTREPRAISVPRRSGGLRRTPREEPREIDLSMWVSNRDVNGLPGGETQLWSNLRSILAVAGPRDRLVTLSRIVDGTTFDIEAELVSTNWEDLSDEAIALELGFSCPYPYWGGPEVSTLLSGGDGTIDNEGHVEATDVEIQLVAGGAAWVNPSIENQTTGVTMTYNGSVAANETYTINLYDGIVVDELSQSISGALDCTQPFFPLEIGENTIVTTESSGAGDVRFVFKPPYIG